MINLGIQISDVNMDTLWIVVGSLLAVLIVFLIVAGFYIVMLLRKVNIIAQKVDYLVEDITYKAEALTPTVDIVNKVSNYAIAIDATANKSAIEFLKVIRNNRSSLIKLMQNILSSFNTIWEKQNSKSKTKDFEEESFEVNEDDTKETTSTSDETIHTKDVKDGEPKKQTSTSSNKKTNTKKSTKSKIKLDDETLDLEISKEKE